MKPLKVAFFIDNLEFKYFEFNKLITSFWLIKEFNERNCEVYISTANKLSLYNNMPSAVLFKTRLTEKKGRLDLLKSKEGIFADLNDMDIVFFRPDPPINIQYIQATYILDYIDHNKTLVLNSSSGIRKANEKLYINNFTGMVPENVTASDANIIKEFINEQGKVVIKPLNKCFGKGVFLVEKGDKNINSIIDASTEAGRTAVMVQKFLPSDVNGDKRVNIICGKLMEETVVKIFGKGDFKFNSQTDEFFVKGSLSDNEREICAKITPKLLADGLYLVGLDFIDEKIIEINVTSPCFFIKELNNLYNITAEKDIIDRIEKLVQERQSKLPLVS